LRGLSGRNDPRIYIIPKRISSIKRIIAVMSSKGGVGKTVVSVLLALALREKGYRTGLLDLDFTNPSTHIVLGINPSMYQPLEDKGIIPPEVHGIRYMSISVYSGDKPTPLRGEAVDEVFREVLAITRWGELEYLVIDTPPGLGDEHLNLLTYMGDRVEALLVSTSSILALESVKKLIYLLFEGGYSVIGLVENMCREKKLEGICRNTGVEYLGCIPYDTGIEEGIGSVDRLKSTKAWKHVLSIADRIAGV